jgi:hypothetical protein
MALHIGEVTSTVNVEGVPGTAGAPDPKASPPWERLEKHRSLTEAVREETRRTAEEGFDG